MAQGDLTLTDDTGTVRIGQFAVTLDGTPDVLRPNLLRLVIAEAARLGTSISLRIDDLGLEYHLVVHPSGEVDEVPVAAPDSSGIIPTPAPLDAPAAPTAGQASEPPSLPTPPAPVPVQAPSRPAAPLPQPPATTPMAGTSHVPVIGYDLRFDHDAAAAVPLRAAAQLADPLVIVVANTKGESGKTPVAVLIAEAFAAVRSNDVLVIDLDPTGNLAARMGTDPKSGRLPDIVAALRATGGEMQWAELAGLLAWQPASHLWAVNARGVTKPRSGSSPSAESHISGEDLRLVLQAIRAGIRVVVIDAGNNDQDAAFLAAAAAADQLVVPLKWDTPTVKDGAGVLLQGLYSAGYHALATQAVIVGTYPPNRRPQRRQEARFRAEFERLGHPIVDLPTDRHIDLRSAIDWSQLRPATRQAASALTELICSRALPSGRRA